MAERSYRFLEAAFLGLCLVGAGALLGPVWRAEREREARLRAEGDCLRLAGALRRCLRDLGGPPRDPRSLLPYHWLYGPGRLPAANRFRDGGAAASLEAVLTRPDPVERGWSGPYLSGLRPDPWGRAYLVNTHGLVAKEEVPWVVSAGPDGILDTPPTSRRLHGDDVGVILRAPDLGR